MRRALIAGLAAGALVGGLGAAAPPAGATQVEELVFGFGDAASASVSSEATPLAGVAAAAGGGHWVATAAGDVLAFGGAAFLGSLRGQPVHAPIVGIAPTASGAGYWLADASGGVFGFGDAGFFGSVPGLRAAGQVIGPLVAVDLAATPSGSGYWIVTNPPSSVLAPPLPPGSGGGRRIVYSNSQQRVWLVEHGERVVGSWLVSGRQGVPAPGVYHVFSRSAMSTARGGSLLLPYMVRFAHGRTLSIGFHAIPIDRYGRPIQSESELGQFRSAGCVRQAPADALRLWDFAPIGTKVVVTP